MLHILELMMGGTSSTWSSTDKTAGLSLTNLNHTANGSTAKDAVRGTAGHSSGKLYFEITAVTINQCLIGVGSSSWSFSNDMGLQDAHSAAYYNGGDLYANSGGTAVSASTYANGDVISVAVDCGNQLIYFAKNGTWQNSADPGAGTGGISYVTLSVVYPAVQFPVASSGSAIATINTGDSDFTYSIPSGFSPWG